MLKKELTLAALAAALLTLGTASVANAAAADCFSDCMEYIGPGFYSPGYFFDDLGNLGEPGSYGYIGCYTDGDGGSWCVYQHEQ
jgi:hypothetical protein